MSRDHISRALRIRITQLDRQQCAYCRTSELNTGSAMDIDHIIPVSRGGVTAEHNLCLACSPCNELKGTHISGTDSLTGQPARLFHPRTRVWSEHFAWADVGLTIIGLTPTGRATVDTLALNRSLLLTARSRWIVGGWHPPDD